MNVFLFIAVLIFSADYGVADAVGIRNGNSSSCNQSQCLRCDLGSSECAKCLHVMVPGSRKCQDKCPPGYDPIWAKEPNVFGRVCQERSVLAMVSNRQVGIIAGASVLGAVCVGILVGILIIRKNRVKIPPDSPPRGLPRSLQDKRPKTAEIVVKGKERAEFLSRLRRLRTDAPYIMRMMAATRSRFKKCGNNAGLDTPADAKNKACKAMIRDLSRVLCLLSLKEEHLQTAPKDWRCLLSWTERLLVRYKRQEEIKMNGEIGGVHDINKSNGNPAGNRNMFVTRQQQLKAEQEKRRLGDRSTSVGNDGEDEKILGSFNRKADGAHIRRPLPPVIMDVKESSEKKDEILHDKIFDFNQECFVSQREECKFSPNKNRNKHIKDFLNFSKNFWLKLTSFHVQKKDDIEKGAPDVVKSADTPIQERLEDFIIGEDDIPSQTFFDHIEAFAFDLQNDLEISSQDNPDVITSNKSDCSDVSSKYSKLSKGSRYKNNLNLYKNYKNSRMMLNNRPNFCPREKVAKNQQNQKLKDIHLGKQSRPSRLRRLSSSILMKDKKQLSVAQKEEGYKPKKRRPLKRQKQVAKEKHSKLLEKYQNSVMQDDSTSVDTQTSGGATKTSVNEVINGEDIYVSVVKTPVAKRVTNRILIPSCIEDDEALTINMHTFQENRNSSVRCLPKHELELEADVESSTAESKIKKLNVQQLPIPELTELIQSRKIQIYDTQTTKCNDMAYPKGFYSRCEILTDV